MYGNGREYGLRSLWGAWFKMAKKARNNLKSIQIKPPPACLPAWKIPAITLSRPPEGFPSCARGPTTLLRLTAQQESCPDMTQSKSLEAPIVTYRWPHPTLISPRRAHVL